MDVRVVHKKDGAWSVLCTKCGHDVAFLSPVLESVKTLKEAIDCPRPQRTAPTIQFEMRLLCKKCRAPAALTRGGIELKVTI